MSDLTVGLSLTAWAPPVLVTDLAIAHMAIDWVYGPEHAEEILRHKRRAAFERAMSPSGRPGIFNDHNCWRCHDGELPCVSGRSSHCEFPHARND